MSWSQTKSNIITFFNTISTKVVLYFSILILVHTLYPLCTQFWASDDYAIYEYFAEAVSKGINPYSIPPGYRSDIVPTFLYVGTTQPSPGVIRQEYADYPPLLMMINSFAFRLHNLQGLYALYILLFALSIALYMVYSNSRKSENLTSEVNPLVFLMFFGLNPIFYQGWFCPITDKVWFAFFTILLLISRNKPYWVAITLGFFAALKGLGIPIMAFYLLYHFFNKSLQLKQILYLILIFGLILVLSHLRWFPDWIKGYQWRSERQYSVNHLSLFLPFDRLGFFWSGMPIVLTIFAFLLLTFLTIKHFVTLDEVLMFPIVFSIIFNTELGYDRLFVAIFAMLLLARNNTIILISYIIGFFLVAFAGSYSWFAVWGWMLLLLSVTGRQLLVRNRTRNVLQTQMTGKKHKPQRSLNKNDQ